MRYAYFSHFFLNWKLGCVLNSRYNFLRFEKSRKHDFPWRTSGFAKILVNFMESETYLLAKVFFTANSPFKSEVHLKFKVIWHFRPHHSCEGLKRFKFVTKQSLLQQKAQSEKLKGRELLEDWSVEWKMSKLMSKEKDGEWLGFIWHETGTNGWSLWIT